MDSLTLVFLIYGYRPAQNYSHHKQEAYILTFEKLEPEGCHLNLINAKWTNEYGFFLQEQKQTIFIA